MSNTDDAESVEVYNGVIDDLFAHWSAVDNANAPLRQPSARRGERFTSRDLARLTLVKATVSNVFDTAQAIQTLHDSKQFNASIPLVRLIFETAFQVSLLVQSRGQHGVDAFLKEYSRQRTALRSTAARSPSDVFRSGAPQITGTDGSAHSVTNDEFHYVERICLDLRPGGIDAYLWYRFLSAYAHPGVDMADLYYEGNDRSGLPVFTPHAKEALPKGVLRYFTAASMLWSARAYSYLTGDKNDRDFLRAIGRRLGVTDSLELSETYHQRHATLAKRSRDRSRAREKLT